MNNIGFYYKGETHNFYKPFNENHIFVYFVWPSGVEDDEPYESFEVNGADTIEAFYNFCKTWEETK